MKIVVVYKYKKTEFQRINPYLYYAITKYPNDVIGVNNKDINIILKDGKQIVKVCGEVVTPETHRFYFTQFPINLSIIPSLMALGFNVTPSIDTIVTRSKLYQYIKYSQAGVNMPNTSLLIDNTMPCAVEKPVTGSLGNNVSLIKNPSITASRPKYLYQEFIDNSKIGDRNDIRAIFYKGNFVGAFKKVCVNPQKTIVTNIAKGNRGEMYEPSQRELDFCKEIINVLPEKNIHAIDYMYDNDGKLWFIETNEFPMESTCPWIGNFYERIIDLMIKEDENN